jgi:hypothetical protein
LPAGGNRFCPTTSADQDQPQQIGVVVFFCHGMHCSPLKVINGVVRIERWTFSLVRVKPGTQMIKWDYGNLHAVNVNVHTEYGGIYSIYVASTKAVESSGKKHNHRTNIA